MRIGRGTKPAWWGAEPGYGRWWEAGLDRNCQEVMQEAVATTILMPVQAVGHHVDHVGFYC